MPWAGKSFGRAVALIMFALILGAGIPSAAASNVQFVGSVGYSSDYSTFAILVIDNIHNNDATGSSAKLRAELWASSTPFAGSFTTAYRLSAYAVGPLAGGASTGKITATTPFSPPPGGTWYIAMVLTEYTGAATNDGFALRQYVNFPGTIVIAGSPDKTSPTVNITSPAGGNVSGTVAVSASASDNVGVSRVDFYVNGGLAGSDSAAPYLYSWDTTKLANGTATLRAVAYDGAGNAGLSPLVSVTIANGSLPPDTTPPTVSISSPTSGNVSGTVTVSASASDNVGVARVDFYVNGGKVGSDSTAPYQYSWNTTPLANGSATLRAVAFDAAGNSTQSSMATVNVANSGTGAAPLLQNAVSRKAHGTAGTFNLPLSLIATNPTTESRQGPSQNIVFTFDKAITGASVAVTEGSATSGAPTFNGNEVVVPLTGVADQQYVTVSLTSVTSSDGGTNGTGSVRLGFLVGDVNGSRTVSIADVGMVNAQLAQSVTAANFANDINASGTITIADKSITNANLTKVLPAP